MKKYIISTDSFFDELEKISTPLGAVLGATVGGLYGAGLSLLGNIGDTKTTQQQKTKNLGRAALTGATFGGVVGAFSPLKMDHFRPGGRLRSRLRAMDEEAIIAARRAEIAEALKSPAIRPSLKLVPPLPPEPPAKK